jgi:hypothetical protein
VVNDIVNKSKQLFFLEKNVCNYNQLKVHEIINPTISNAYWCGRLIFQGIVCLVIGEFE